MKWYWQIRDGHTHVRVFMNGAKCGDLCFRNEEFEVLRKIDELARLCLNAEVSRSREENRKP